MPTIADVRDRAETMIAGTTPRYLAALPFVRASGAAPIEQLESSVTSTARQFEVRPGEVIERGSYDGPCYEMRQRLEVIVRYGIDPQTREVGYTSWRTVRAMAAADAADLIVALEHRAGTVTTWAGVAFSCAIESTELPEYPDDGRPAYLRLVYVVHYPLEGTP